jgi:2'-5' RNA ligase
VSRGATARLFAAVDPPPVVCEQLASWAREAAGSIRSGGTPLGAGASVRLLAPETMHITLCFLGARAVEELDALARALDSCATQGDQLSLGAPLWLPPRNPRSLALELHDREGWLARLQSALSQAFAQAVDWQPERRRFRAHVTVARIGRGGTPSRRRGRGARGREAHEPAIPAPLPATPQLSFVPATLVLYRSWLAPQGASYEPVATCGLTGATSPSSSPSSTSSEEGGDGEVAP